MAQPWDPTHSKALAVVILEHFTDSCRTLPDCIYGRFNSGRRSQISSPDEITIFDRLIEKPAITKLLTLETVSYTHLTLPTIYSV